MAAEQAWYIAERAEALATLFLTRRNDIEVMPSGRYGRSTGYDLLVRIITPGISVDATFGIEVKGVRAEKRRGKHSFLVNYTRNEITDIGLPICIFLFAVDDEQGYYRWLFKPIISPSGRAEIHFDLRVTYDDPAQRERIAVRSDFAPLTNHAIDAIIEQVKRWYGIRG